MTDPGSQFISVQRAIDIAIELHRCERIPDAIGLLRLALENEPGNTRARACLGDALRDAGRIGEAEIEYRHALALDAGNARAANNIGVLLTKSGRAGEAESFLRHSLAMAPDSPEIHNNLGVTLVELGRLDEAEQCYRAALGRKPDHADALNNLGTALRGMGRLDEAVRCYRRAIAIGPDIAGVHSNLLFTLNCMSGLGAGELLAEHREFERKFCKVSIAERHRNDRDVQRRLRLGYVSGDFRDHSVSLFFEPILNAHDRSAFEIYCYSNNRIADAVTQRLKERAHHWRDIHELDDGAAAALIRDDEIDILVDLSGHSGGNRLPMFGIRPAPVQVTYLGYPASTGLAAIDYRITDGVVDPPGRTDCNYAERLVRLPDTMWCFLPRGGWPGSAHTYPTRSLVTFASFNHRAKITSQVLAVWARLLAQLPNARFVATSIPDGSSQDEMQSEFVRHGVDKSRLEIHDRLPRDRFEALVSCVDVALDPFPYNGTTTTCDLLSRGVPVVTMSGSTPASRCGASLLRSVGLGDLVASSEDDYIGRARNLVLDRIRLERVRAELGSRVRASPLADARRFTLGLEGAFREMWRNWCNHG